MAWKAERTSSRASAWVWQGSQIENEGENEEATNGCLIQNFNSGDPTTNPQHASLAYRPSENTDVIPVTLISRPRFAPTSAQISYTTPNATILQRYTGNVRLSFCTENASSSEERTTTLVYLKT